VIFHLVFVKEINNLKDYSQYSSENSKIDEKPKKKRFRLFDFQKDGKGVSKEDAIITPDLKGFFKSFFRNFNRLLSVNIFMVLGNFPFIFAVIALSGLFKIDYLAPDSWFFSQLHGIMLNFDPESSILSPSTMALFGIEGIQLESAAMTPLSYLFWGLSAAIIFTFGFVNVGTTYIIRNMIKGEPVFMWSDFWYAIKRNKKQAFWFGILDIAIMIIVPFNIITLISNLSTIFSSLIFWTNVVIGVLYIFMRFYIYMQMITFDLSIFKILKNSFSFALLGLKRNVLALLGIVLLVFINYMLLMGMGGMLMPLGIAAPLVILFAAGSYMGGFASYFKIKEIMIDPYQDTEMQETDSQDI
jgi:uncharacterized membrane protein YesL